jgi:hypothetical protein
VPPWLEDGAVVFDLVHLWSEERNIVRGVLDVEAKGETLHATVQKIGQLRPTELDIHRECDPRTASAKRTARAAYQRVLERVLRKHFLDWTLLQLNTAMDLEKSFGPIYCRGLVKHGLSAFAFLGVNRQELQASIDAALTFGILWLDSCRGAHSSRLLVARGLAPPAW